MLVVLPSLDLGVTVSMHDMYCIPLGIRHIAVEGVLLKLSARKNFRGISCMLINSLCTSNYSPFTCKAGNGVSQLPTRKRDINWR